MGHRSAWGASVATVWMLAAGCGASPAEPTRVYVPTPCASGAAASSPGEPARGPVRPPPPPSAGPAAGATRPRSVTCEAVNDRQFASFQVSDDGTHYVGGGADHYDTVRFARCPLSETSEIRCESVWAFDQKAAVLRVIVQSDGVVRGELTRSSGEVAVLSCVASASDLRTR